MGPGSLGVPFTCRLSASVEFSVFRGEAFSVPEGVQVFLGDSEKDHFFDAQAHLALDVEGLLALELEGWKKGWKKATSLKLEDVFVEEMSFAKVVESSEGIFQ